MQCWEWAMVAKVELVEKEISIRSHCRNMGKLMTRIGKAGESATLSQSRSGGARINDGLNFLQRGCILEPSRVYDCELELELGWVVECC